MDEAYRIGAYLRGLLSGLVGGGSGGSMPPPPDHKVLPSQYPIGGIDFITHTLRVRLEAKKAGLNELVDMDGAMVIQRGDPYFGKDGRRRIDFKVLSWVATGWIHKLSAALTYTLSADVEQPLSAIIAHDPGRDFPTAINFSVIFDARINNLTVYKQLRGQPEGHAFLEIPPTGDRLASPTITRFTDQGQVQMDHPDLGQIVVFPVDCNDQSGATRVSLPGTPIVRMPDIGRRPRRRRNG